MWLGAIFFSLFGLICADEYRNISNIQSVGLQLLQYKKSHKWPIGIQTVSAGAPVDIRDNYVLNTDILSLENALDQFLSCDRERIPPRVVHAKGAGAQGYFEVTHDVSHYTKADVFNGIGKETPVSVRFSIGIEDFGGNDLAIVDLRGLAVKFYTKEGNLDLLSVQSPVYIYRNPVDFSYFLRVFKRNPKTHLADNNPRWDLVTKKPTAAHAVMWFFSDYGVPDGYRKMDAFPIHTFRTYNKHGDSFFVRFSWRTEQGLANLTLAQILTMRDTDYYNRDLYNAIEAKDYPSWRLEMDVLTTKLEELENSPFDVTRMWQPGTYKTVTIGRMKLNKNPDNFFRDVELMALNPANLVPGIGAPIDQLFKAKRLAYRDTQNYRIGKNKDLVKINEPLYTKTYNRDGLPPVGDNMGAAPNYYPNVFKGPIPYIDEDRPKTNFVVLESHAVDLQPAADFYNTFARDEGHRQRIVEKMIAAFINVLPKLQERVIRLMSLIDDDLGTRLRVAVTVARASGIIPSETPITKTASGIIPSATPITKTASGIIPSATPITKTASGIIPSATPITKTASGIIPSATPITKTSSSPQKRRKIYL